MLKSLKEKTSQSVALVKIDAQQGRMLASSHPSCFIRPSMFGSLKLARTRPRGFATPPRQFSFFLSNLSTSYLSRYASYPKLRL
jgi:hypothetical protein